MQPNLETPDNIVHAFEEDYVSDLDFILRKTFGVNVGRNKKLSVSSESFGWNKSVVGKIINNDVQSLLSLFSFDHTMKIYKKRSKFHGVHLEIIVFHHDSQMGDVF